MGHLHNERNNYNTNQEGVLHRVEGSGIVQVSACP